MQHDSNESCSSSSSSSSGRGIITVASLPVDDEIPLGYDACTRHPRGFQFHPCRGNDDDATIIYAVATDGGASLTEGRTDANMAEKEEAGELVDGEHDAVYCRVIKQLDDDNNNWTLSEPTKLVGLKGDSRVLILLNRDCALLMNTVGMIEWNESGSSKKGRWVDTGNFFGKGAGRIGIHHQERHCCVGV